MLKPYMFYSYDPSDGAALVFAHTAREAIKIGWDRFGDLFADRYIDCRASLMRNSDYLFVDADPEKLKNDIPHAVLEPTGCKSCETWGKSPIDANGLCEDCQYEYLNLQING